VKIIKRTVFVPISHHEKRDMSANTILSIIVFQTNGCMFTTRYATIVEVKNISAEVKIDVGGTKKTFGDLATTKNFFLFYQSKGNCISGSSKQLKKCFLVMIT
jgi:hypothetical protein